VPPDRDRDHLWRKPANTEDLPDDATEPVSRTLRSANATLPERGQRSAVGWAVLGAPAAAGGPGDVRGVLAGVRGS
jgi:hypothetical protein